VRCKHTYNQCYERLLVIRQRIPIQETSCKQGMQSSTKMSRVVKQCDLPQTRRLRA
jgi:hypothetical protein